MTCDICRREGGRIRKMTETCGKGSVAMQFEGFNSLEFFGL